MGFSDLLHTHVCAIVFLVSVSVQAQLYVDDSCVLAYGNAGKCVRFENCPSAIEMVRQRKGTPVQCGFEGIQPIVCCETKADYKGRRVGEISKQKCAENYGVFPTSTTPTPISFTTVELPANISFEELIKLAEKEAQTGGSRSVLTAVGGVDAKPEEFPHMAVLGYGELAQITWGCGGSLISEKHILTAAHCIKTALGPVKFVRLGDLNLNLTTDRAKPQDHNVAKTIIHHGYKAPSVYHDIAIIELAANAEINDFVRPGCLNTETNISTTEWSATGWGVTSYLGTPADHLQEVNLRPFTKEECQSAYASTPKRRLANGIDFNSQICAGEAYKDTCQGDSGGPLQVKNSDFEGGYKLIGVTSFGKACGIGISPAVYTRVSHYIEWIESIVWPQ